MRFLPACLLATVLLVPAWPAHAGVRPYVRAGYGGFQLHMSEVDANMMADQDAIRAAGLPAGFKKIGPAIGADVSAGFWLFPGFRIGGTWSSQKSYRENRVHVPGQFFYADQLDFRMTEIGGEAMLRSARVWGLCLGGSVSQARAKFIEGYSVEDAGGQLYFDDTASARKTTYAAFIGLDQTNDGGGAGFLRIGYRWRDMGHMPLQGTASDGVNTQSFTGTTVRMDYSGVYFTAGIGFDVK